MRITELLDKRSISLTGAPKSKSEALDQAVELMVKSGKINDREAYRKQVYAREEESTTGIGEGIAIPHGKCDAVSRPGLAAMVVKDGVDFDSLDGEPVTLIFLIAAPNTEDNVHLDVLSKLSVLMMDEDFSDSLRSAGSVEEFLEIIDRADEEKADIDQRLQDTGEAGKTGAKILAVTSCPTGIAHTYMAAEGIEKAAKEKGCYVKIETRGSGGAKNVLSAREIQEADCIIVAADAQVPMDRFDGKKVIQCQVSDGISKAGELLDRALAGDALVYHASAGSQPSAQRTGKSGGVGHQIYTQLMNGVSHMLPFVVGGGILIALAFLIDGICVDMDALDIAERANFGTITPAAAWFKNLGGVAFGPDVDVDPAASGVVALGSGLAQPPYQFLQGLHVGVGEDGGDHLALFAVRPIDAHVPLELPLAALGIPGRPGVVPVAVGGVLEPPGAEELGGELGGGVAGNAVHLHLNPDGLLFHLGDLVFHFLVHGADLRFCVSGGVFPPFGVPIFALNGDNSKIIRNVIYTNSWCKNCVDYLLWQRWMVSMIFSCSAASTPMLSKASLVPQSGQMGPLPSLAVAGGAV